MTADEIKHQLLYNDTVPVVLRDHSHALLIRACGHDGRCGVQVPGEPDIRLIDPASLEDAGGFLYEIG